MSNIIRLYKNTPASRWLQMSNMSTDAFINIVLLSGSALAQNDNEKQLIVWLAEKDQSCVGGGTVDFDIVDMPWSKDNFSAEKSFMLAVIDNGINKNGWNILEYTPNEHMLIPFLEKFKKLIEELSIKDISDDSRKEWLDYADSNDPVKCGFPYCKKHNTLLSIYGCQICNN